MNGFVQKKQPESLKEMEYVRCNNCGDDNAETAYKMPDEFYFPDEFFTVVRCKTCGLGYLNPRPEQNKISRFYPPHFFEFFDTEESFNLQRYKNEANYILRHNQYKEGLMLDIGCANGDFPRFMSKNYGFIFEGVEIAENAKGIKDFKVYNDVLPNIPFEKEKYIVATAWAVLEHVHNPMAYFKKVSDLLKSGGIFVFNVPNFDSLSSCALFQEDIPRHLYFFNHKTISDFLVKNNMSLVKAVYDKDIYTMAPQNWLLYYLKKMWGKKLSYGDLPARRRDFLKNNNLKPSRKATWLYAKYLLKTSPLFFLDRLLAPLYEKWQILTNQYGMVTYVARKL